MTVIDGKVLNTLTGTPRSVTEVRRDFKTAKEFDPKPDTLQYGLSPLHAWIRIFECILLISYRYVLYLNGKFVAQKRRKSVTPEKN